MQQHSKTLKTALLMTGSELISGDTIDSNSAWLGQILPGAGLDIMEKVTVGDNLDMLVAQMQRLSGQYDLLLINGGLGPTRDDLTATAMACIDGKPPREHPDAKAHVENWCSERGVKMNTANLSQAMLPQSADIFLHAPGSASAFYLQHNNCLLIATPGIPSELKKIVQQQLLPFLEQRYQLIPSTPWQQYQLFGIGESTLQQMLDDDFAELNKTVDIGFRVNFPYIELKIKPLPGIEQTEADNACRILLSQLSDYLIGPAGSTVGKAVVDQLKQLGKTVSSAESCTGGLIAAEITAVAGASDVFPGSIISYSNSIKQKLLHVQPQTLNEQGAVSQATAEQMLDGLLQQTGSDYGIAVSGIAGPGGGSLEKPTGTVWLAWGNNEQRHSLCLCVKLGRHLFQQLVSTIALDILRRNLAGINSEPSYIRRWKTD